ncbi:hypothetical protein A2U01_0005752, partial [Trifolium medium]|nr:hypothetical protein [Trifolium medium]
EASTKLNAEVTQRSQHLRQDESSGNDIVPGATSDQELDAQLETLRKKLAEVGKESEMLSQEIHALERQSSHNARYINEAVQLFEQNPYNELFQGATGQDVNTVNLSM